MSTKQRDAALEEIATWCTWFVTAHRERLDAAGVSPEQAERELAPIREQAKAIRARLVSEYLQRTGARI